VVLPRRPGLREAIVRETLAIILHVPTGLWTSRRSHPLGEGDNLSGHPYLANLVYR
jgi:hypothetical protein